MADASAAVPARRFWQLPEHFPTLHGRRATVIAALYLVLAAVTLAMFAAGTWYRGVDSLVNAPESARFDFRGYSRPSGFVVDGVGPAAKAAGLRNGDRIRVINGRALAQPPTDNLVAGRLGGGGDRLDLGVDRGSQRVAVQLRAKERVWTSIDPFSGVPLALYALLTLVVQPQLFLIVASILLFRNRPRDAEAMMFAFAFLLLNWTFDNLWWLYTIGMSPGTISLAGTSGWIISFMAIGAFPDGRFVIRWSRWLIPAGLLLQAFDVATTLLWDTTPAWVGNATTLGLLVMATAATTAVILRYRRTTVQMERQQVKWAVAGFCITALTFLIITPLFVTNSLNVTGDPIAFFALNVVAPITAYGGLALGLLISILRFRLYDAEAVISRSAGYAVLTIVLAASVAAVIKGVELSFENYSGNEAGALPGVIGAGVGVALITPLHTRIQAWAERRFQKGLLELRRDLSECVGDMRETASLVEMAEEIVGRVAEGIRASRTALIVGGKIAATCGVRPETVEEWRPHYRLDDAVEGYECDRSDTQFPIRQPLRVRHGSDEPVGWLLVGPRPDGSLHNMDEREVLADLSDPIARAVQIVLVREARDAETDRQRAVQEDRLSAIEQQLATALEAVARFSP